ncbi:MAG: RecX family transcriptional regulator [bacterium]
MKLTRLEPQRKSKRRVSVFLDGAYAFSLDEKTVSRLGLTPGAELSEADVERIVRDDQLSRAKEYAALLLSYRARTEKEMQERLARKGFAPDIVAAAMDRLRELRLLDDEQYARDFTRDRVTIGRKGKWNVRGELMKRGVARKAIEAALAEAPDELAVARDLAARYRQRHARLEPEVLRRRLYAMLARRGFSPDVIRPALELPEDE